MTTLLEELHHAARGLLRAPGFTLVTVLTLAIGIGANTAMFSVVDGVLLRQLPYEDPGELHSLSQVDPTGRVSGFHVPQIIAMRERQRSWQGLAATSAVSTLPLSGAGRPEQVGVKRVSANLFELLGVRAALGRVLESGEDRREAEAVAVLGHGFWERRFGADPDVLGRIVELNGRAHTIVGVMGPEFVLPFPDNEAAEVFVPRVYTEEDEDNWGYFSESVIGRLRPDVTVEQARDDVRRMQRELRAEHPEMSERQLPQGVEILPLRQEIVGDVGWTLWLLMGAVGVVLLVVCANVTDLVLARNASRRPEIALRAALGAGRGRLVFRLLAEMSLLSGAGGALGLLLAAWLTGFFLAMAPESIPRLEEVALDLRVFCFTASVSVAAGLLIGAAPALRGAATSPAAMMRGAGPREGGAAAPRRFLAALVAAECALVLVLLVAAGLLFRSFQQLQGVDPGFDRSGRLAVQMTLSSIRYPDSESIAVFYQRLLDEIRGIPGVEAAGGIWAQPLSGSSRIRLPMPMGEGSDADPEGQQEIEFNAVTPGFFEASGMRMVSGRDFRRDDHLGDVEVAIVNQSFADYYWPEGGATGRRYSHDRGETWVNVVGVVADTTNQGLGSPAMPTVYWPQRQVPFAWNSMDVVVDTSLDTPASLVPAVREAVWAVDPEQPVGSIRSFDAMVADSVRRERFELWLFGTFATVALGLGVVGIYSVSSYSVSRRVREIGIRMALGAGAGEVVRMVVARGMLPVAAGVAAGLPAALGLARLMGGLLFEISPVDPVTFLAVAALLVGVAGLAILRPARRAAAVDPLEAMRVE